MDLRRAAALLCALAAAPAFARDGDPLDAPACRQALEAVRASEAQALAERESGASAPRSARSRLEAARLEAAKRCLGSRPDAPPPQHLATPPVATPPVDVAKPAPARPAAPTPAIPAPRASPPAVFTACDDTGCWTSDGIRLQRVGPQLLGPRGFCSSVNGLLQCP